MYARVEETHQYIINSFLQPFEILNQFEGIFKFKTTI